MGIFTECPKCYEKDDEIERLRRKVQELSDERDIFARTLNKRDAGIERLCQLLRDAGVPEWVINNEG
jgi:hypothetical protein